jgi:hypothetical protein
MRVNPNPLFIIDSSTLGIQSLSTLPTLCFPVLLFESKVDWGQYAVQPQEV